MYAIVDIAGQQFKVEKDSKLYVHRLEGKEGSKVSFDKVLLVDDKGKVSVGTPNVAGVSVSAKIVSHLRDDKVLVFKKKRRKGYQKLNGHRQDITEIVIEGIGKGTAKKAPASKAKKETASKAAKKTPAPKAVKKEAAPKAEKKPATKTPAAKKAAAKKAAPKKKDSPKK
jgi:large subunit ribosomal protein L21